MNALSAAAKVATVGCFDANYNTLTGINLYPNLAIKCVIVNGVTAGTKVSIVNIFGAGMGTYTTITKSSQLRIDLSNFRPGIYLIKAELNGKYYSTKILEL